jgi:hypothetical protein
LDQEIESLQKMREKFAAFCESQTQADNTKDTPSENGSADMFKIVNQLFSKIAGAVASAAISENDYDYLKPKPLVNGTLENIEMETEHPVNGSLGAERVDSIEDRPLITNVKEVQYGIMLMTEMKTLRLAGQSEGNDYKDMAAAYDILAGRMDENPTPTQRHADAKGINDEMKYLNGGFADLADSFSAINARSDFWSGVEHDWQNPHFNDEANERLKLMVADAEEQAAVFADAFLKNYKKLGLDAALKFALSLLDSYETTYMMRQDFPVLDQLSPFD